MKRQLLKTILFALPKVLNRTARKYPAFRERLKQRDLSAWIGLQDGSIGRVFQIREGKIYSSSGPSANCDVCMIFKDVATALTFLLPNPDPGKIMHTSQFAEG